MERRTHHNSWPNYQNKSQDTTITRYIQTLPTSHQSKAHLLACTAPNQPQRPQSVPTPIRHHWKSNMPMRGSPWERSPLPTPLSTLREAKRQTEKESRNNGDESINVIRRPKNCEGDNDICRGNWKVCLLEMRSEIHVMYTAGGTWCRKHTSSIDT